MLGIITDPILAEVSAKLKCCKVYNTYGEANSMMAFGISHKPGYINLVPGLKTISMSLKDNTRIFSILSDKKIISTSIETSNLIMTMRSTYYLKSIITNSLFTVIGQTAKFLGHAFSNGVCPMYIESIFNSFPFIKDSVLIWYKGKYILLLDVDEAILDANRINYLFFNKIMKGQIEKINKDLLPETIQIMSFAQIPSAILRYNRMGLLDKNFLYNVEFLG